MKVPVKPEFDEYASCYEAELRQSIPNILVEDAYFAEYKIRHIARRIRNENPLMILDFGCGIGRSLGLLRHQFPNAELWGFDVSEQSVDIARQRTEKLSLTCNLDELPLNAFDVILAANVFHHIPHDARLDAVEQCKRLLKVDGRFFLFEHNPFNPFTRLIFERCPYDQGATMLRRQEALKLAIAAGLVVIKSDYTLFFPRQLSPFRPFEKFLGWLPLGAQYCVEMAK